MSSNYHFYSTRLKSFNSAWPHPNIPPERLAQAGFFFSPEEDTPYSDLVTCFYCQTSMEKWTVDDDPTAAHFSDSPECPLMQVQYNQKEDTKLDHLRRLQTFFEPLKLKSAPRQADRVTGKMEYLLKYGQKLWPYTKEWKADPNSLAETGFYFSPLDGSVDGVTCQFCGLVVDGWEKQDDPTKEHKARSPKCLIFKSKTASKQKSKRGRNKENNSEEQTRALRKSKRTVNMKTKAILSDSSTNIASKKSKKTQITVKFENQNLNDDLTKTKATKEKKVTENCVTEKSRSQSPSEPKLANKPDSPLQEINEFDIVESKPISILPTAGTSNELIFTNFTEPFSKLSEMTQSAALNSKQNSNSSKSIFEARQNSTLVNPDSVLALIEPFPIDQSTDMDLTVQEYTNMLAEKAEEFLRNKAEQMIAILQEEAEKAKDIIKNIPVADD